MDSLPSSESCGCVKAALNHGNLEFVEALRCALEQRDETKTGSQSDTDSHNYEQDQFEQLGLAGGDLEQFPRAAVLTCSDARVPVEDLFQQPANEMFEIQLAGNVASVECLGSLAYAVEHIPTIEGIVVLGHTGCGAVTAAVDQFLSPRKETISTDSPIQSLMNAISPSVEIAASGMSQNYQPIYGNPMRCSLDRGKLIDTAIFVNASAMAWKISEVVKKLRRSVPVWYGVYDLASCRILHVDLERKDGSLLFGLGNAPGIIDVDDIARSLVRYLSKMDNFDAAKFSTTCHNDQTMSTWESLTTGVQASEA